MMRNTIVWFAWIAPLLFLILWPYAPIVGLFLLMLSHGLLLYPTLSPNVQWLGPVITAFETDRKEVWLTIDDGPSHDTPALLDLLDERGARATFFVTGANSAAAPDLIRSIVARGHEVANHSQTHPSGWFWCLPPARIREEIDRCTGVLEGITGRVPRFFRAPVGMKNPGVHPHLRRRQMTLIGWTVRGFDSVDGDERNVAARILPKAVPGAIIVMHQGRDHSLRCINHVIDRLQESGYSFVIPDNGRLKTKR
jgi:peptidoglycan/xylan/chitin deacetylase (PgdA/CDA1 family)